MILIPPTDQALLFPIIQTFTRGVPCRSGCCTTLVHPYEKHQRGTESEAQDAKCRIDGHGVFVKDVVAELVEPGLAQIDQAGAADDQPVDLTEGVEAKYFGGVVTEGMVSISVTVRCCYGNDGVDLRHGGIVKRTQQHEQYHGGICRPDEGQGTKDAYSGDKGHKNREHAGCARVIEQETYQRCCSNTANLPSQKMSATKDHKPRRMATSRHTGSAMSKKALICLARCEDPSITSYCACTVAMKKFIRSICRMVRRVIKTNHGVWICCKAERPCRAPQTPLVS